MSPFDFRKEALKMLRDEYPYIKNKGEHARMIATEMESRYVAYCKRNLDNLDIGSPSAIERRMKKDSLKHFGAWMKAGCGLA